MYRIYKQNGYYMGIEYAEEKMAYIVAGILSETLSERFIVKMEV